MIDTTHYPLFALDIQSEIPRTTQRNISSKSYWSGTLLVVNHSENLERDGNSAEKWKSWKQNSLPNFIVCVSCFLLNFGERKPIFHHAFLFSLINSPKISLFLLFLYSLFSFLIFILFSALLNIFSLSKNFLSQFKVSLLILLFTSRTTTTIFPQNIISWFSHLIKAINVMKKPKHYPLSSTGNNKNNLHIFRQNEFWDKKNLFVSTSFYLISKSFRSNEHFISDKKGF